MKSPPPGQNTPVDIQYDLFMYFLAMSCNGPIAMDKIYSSDCLSNDNIVLLPHVVGVENLHSPMQNPPHV